MADEEPIIEEEPRMVFVTENEDGGYSARVSPAVTKKEDLDNLVKFFSKYSGDMMDAARRKFEGEGEEDGTSSLDAAGGIKSFGQSKSSGEPLDKRIGSLVGGFSIDDRVLVKDNDVWYPAKLTSNLLEGEDNMYQIMYDDDDKHHYIKSGNDIAKMPDHLPGSENGYTKDSSGKFIPRTSGGSSNAKKSRKSYRKKQRKSYRRK